MEGLLRPTQYNPHIVTLYHIHKDWELLISCCYFTIVVFLCSFFLSLLPFLLTSFFLPFLYPSLPPFYDWYSSLSNTPIQFSVVFHYPKIFSFSESIYLLRVLFSVFELNTSRKQNTRTLSCEIRWSLKKG